MSTTLQRFISMEIEYPEAINQIEKQTNSIKDNIRWNYRFFRYRRNTVSKKNKHKWLNGYIEHESSVPGEKKYSL